jgi:proline dehydrogenase
MHCLLPILDPLIPLNSYLLPHASLFTDYIPIIQQIVAADDVLYAAEQAAIAAGEKRVNRKTGRPIRINANVLGSQGYPRYLDMREAELETVRGLWLA